MNTSEAMKPNATARNMREEAHRILHFADNDVDSVLTRNTIDDKAREILTRASNRIEEAEHLLAQAQRREDAGKLTGRDRALIVAGIRSLQHFGPAPGSEGTPETGGTDGLCEDINLANAVILETRGTDGRQEEQERADEEAKKVNEPEAIRREYPNDDFTECPNCGGMNERGRKCDCKDKKEEPAEKPKPYPSFEDAAFAFYDLIGELRSEQKIYQNRIDEPTELEARIDRAIERFELFQEG